MASDDFVRCECGLQFDGDECEALFLEHMESAMQLDEPGHTRADAFKRWEPSVVGVSHRRVMGNFGFDEDDEADDDEPELRPQ